MDNSSGSLAPTDFNLSTTSFDYSRGAISVALEHCRLCSGSKRTFYCKDCVCKGEFVHSGLTGHKYQDSTYAAATSNRYADELKRWHALKKDRTETAERLECMVAERLHSETKQTEIRIRRQKAHLLSVALDGVKCDLANERLRLNELSESNVQRQQRSLRHAQKRANIRAYIDRAPSQIEALMEELKSRRAQLSELRRTHIEDLVRYIFPITEARCRSDADSTQTSESTTDSTVTLLADARHTAYVKGRWINTDSGCEHPYRIVAPTLPGNGDYSAHYTTLCENVDATPNTDLRLGERNPAYTISAALSLATQLVSCLAYFLDVNLPLRLNYDEFCGSELSESRFRRAVLRLNHNVLYLCFVQNVDLQTLRAQHTIHNIQMLLCTPDLGRSYTGALCNSDLQRSIEDSLQSAGASPDDDFDMAVSDDSSDETSSVDRVDSAVERDWEHVSVCDVVSPLNPGHSVSLPTQSAYGGGEAQATGYGLVTSAVASFWRGWGRTDK